MTGPFDEREARRQYVRRRQTIVFGIVSTVLVAVLIIAMLFYTHVLGHSAGSSPAAQLITASRLHAHRRIRTATPASTSTMRA